MVNLPSASEQGRVPTSVVMLQLAITFALVSQGAFYRVAFGVFAGLVVVAAGLAVRERQTARWPARPPVPAVCLLLILSTVISGLVKGRTASSWVTIAALTLVALVSWLVGTASNASRVFLLHGMVVSAVGVALAGMMGVLARYRPLGLVDGGLWRAASTLTYANATAAVLGMALPIAIAIASASESRSSRLRDQGCVAVIAAGLLLTASRAGIAGALAGQIVLGRLVGPFVLRRSGQALLAGLVLFAGAAASMPAQPSLATSLRLGIFIAAALAAGVIVGWSARRSVGGVVPISVAVPVGALVMSSALVVGLRNSALRERLSLDSPSRVEEWRAALRLFRSSPLFGVGPGPTELKLRGTSLRTVVFVHNEYLQLLAQQGLVGVGALVVGVAIVVRSVRTLAGPRSLLVSSAIAGLSVLGLQAAFDYVLHIPAIGVGAAVLLALVTTREDVRHGTNEPVPTS